MSTAKHRDSALYLVGFRYDEMTGDRIMLTKPVPVSMTTSSSPLGGSGMIVDFIDPGSPSVKMLDITERVSYFGIFDTLEDKFGPRLLVRFDRDVFTANGVGIGLAVAMLRDKAMARIQIRSIP